MAAMAADPSLTSASLTSASLTSSRKSKKNKKKCVFYIILHGESTTVGRDIFDGGIKDENNKPNFFLVDDNCTIHLYVPPGHVLMSGPGENNDFKRVIQYGDINSYMRPQRISMMATPEDNIVPGDEEKNINYRQIFQSSFQTFKPGDKIMNGDLLSDWGKPTVYAEDRADFGVWMKGKNNWKKTMEYNNGKFTDVHNVRGRAFLGFSGGGDRKVKMSELIEYLKRKHQCEEYVFHFANCSPITLNYNKKRRLIKKTKSVSGAGGKDNQDGIHKDPDFENEEEIISSGGESSLDPENELTTEDIEQRENEWKISWKREPKIHPENPKYWANALFLTYERIKCYSNGLHNAKNNPIKKSKKKSTMKKKTQIRGSLNEQNRKWLIIEAKRILGNAYKKRSLSVRKRARSGGRLPRHPTSKQLKYMIKSHEMTLHEAKKARESRKLHGTSTLSRMGPDERYEIYYHFLKWKEIFEAAKRGEEQGIEPATIARMREIFPIVISSCSTPFWEKTEYVLPGTNIPIYGISQVTEKKKKNGEMINIKQIKKGLVEIAKDKMDRSKLLPLNKFPRSELTENNKTNPKELVAKYGEDIWNADEFTKIMYNLTEDNVEEYYEKLLFRMWNSGNSVYETLTHALIGMVPDDFKKYLYRFNYIEEGKKSTKQQEAETQIKAAMAVEPESAAMAVEPESAAMAVEHESVAMEVEGDFGSLSDGADHSMGSISVDRGGKKRKKKKTRKPKRQKHAKNTTRKKKKRTI